MNKLNISQTDDGKLGEILDEILSKMGRGEEPDIDAYIRQHPEAAEILKHAFPAIRAVADSIGGSDAAVGKHDSIMPDKALGDFRIVRELGRGGMGVVYEADQISLGRKVALKVLPFAGMIRENALQRFHNEVRAAASLDHPYIVSVYSIGEERGVHYYAMQLIQGQTLADVIAQLTVLRRSKTPITGESLSHAISAYRPSGGSSATDPTEQHCQPPENVPPPSTERAIQANVDTLVNTGHDRQFYHSIASLGIQAADALQHAHDNGVLHRDIKPGNLMLDAESQLYITDFGLARIETDAAMTMTGDLIGTLRYMSPEQALAKRVVIDHRSDIYSLGATLYEAISLTPVFVAEDRQELLKQIAFEEPTKLRKIDRSIPGELETIVHKAIAKNPDERYATAEELADDLRAFQQNRPIKAKPPSMLQRSGKWAQRHRPVVATAMCALLVLTFTAAAVAWKDQSAVAQGRTRFATANAFLAGADYESAKGELNLAQGSIEQSVWGDRKLQHDLEVLRTELDAKSAAQDKANNFQRLRGQVQAKMYDTPPALMPQLQAVCKEALDLFHVFENDGLDEQSDFRNLPIAEQSELREGIGEMLFVWARAEVNRNHDGSSFQVAHRNAIDALRRIEPYYRFIPGVHRWIAEYYRALGDQKSETDEVGLASSEPNKSALDFFVLGEFYSYQNDDRRAVEEYTNALAAEPDHFLSLLALGMAIHELRGEEGDEIAEAYLTGAIALNANTTLAYLRRSALRISMGNRQAAEADLQKAEQLEPDHFHVRCVERYTHLSVRLAQRPTSTPFSWRETPSHMFTIGVDSRFCPKNAMRTPRRI